MTPKRIAFCIYASLLLVVNLAIFSAPFLAVSGNSVFASKIYDAMQPFCHQWIYRSACLFISEDAGSSISQCIAPDETHAELKTEFTSSEKQFDGPAVFSKSQIGFNRADVIIYNGKIGYKFPVCLRDIGFYLAMLLAILLYKPMGFDKNAGFPIIFIIICAVPMGVDGMMQILIPSYESFAPFRFATGFASGFLAGLYITKNFFE